MYGVVTYIRNIIIPKPLYKREYWTTE